MVAPAKGGGRRWALGERLAGTFQMVVGELCTTIPGIAVGR
jgi:hypothetical protein